MQQLIALGFPPFLIEVAEVGAAFTDQLGQLLHLLGPLPEPWPRWLETRGPGWTSWANIDPQLLQWELHRQPLEPLQEMAGLLRGRGALLIGSITGGSATAPWPTASVPERVVASAGSE